MLDLSSSVVPDLKPTYMVSASAKSLYIDLSSIKTTPAVSSCPPYAFDIVIGNDIDIGVSLVTKSIFTVSTPSANTVILKAETYDLYKVGTYKLKLRAWLYDLNDFYTKKGEQTLEYTFLNPCNTVATLSLSPIQFKSETYILGYTKPINYSWKSKPLANLQGTTAYCGT